ncbi:hypothetical protein YA0089_26365 [Pseudomonas viridiflava]|uniref:hypothetical protein n=1 Tax=Pseudomonas viridiflava TaxID=33069 RepID=UPI0018E5BFE5|nr:hypothetical protein [Pseudomonas viridiflava]MBI6727141.1 hypothetical protein [Pseudomonas viridiflava]
MSNTLTIEFVEVKSMEGGMISCGFIATDAVNETFNFAASSWDAFRTDFPDVEAVMNFIIELRGFYANRWEFEMIDAVTPRPLEDEGKSIMIIGSSAVYGE